MKNSVIGSSNAINSYQFARSMGEVWKMPAHPAHPAHFWVK